MDISFFKNKNNYRYDELTDIYDRYAINSYMDELVSKKTPFSFVILDIDNFKFVNDNYGHLVGDEVLKIVAKSIEKECEDFGVVGRYGGDEFIFVFPNVQEYEDIWKCALKILKSTVDLEIPMAKDLNISYTMGCSRFPLDTTNLDELFELADKALYRGKLKGRNCFIVYLPEKHKDIDVLNHRDKVYSPLYINNKFYTSLITNRSFEEGIKDSLSFLGATLMIDHICIERDGQLNYEYFHPLSKKFGGYEAFGYDTIMKDIDVNGLFYVNVTKGIYDNDNIALGKKYKEQGIYSSFLAEIKAYEFHYGFLRCDMVAVDTGRIWQQTDLVTLVHLANVLGLLFYINEDK